VNNNVLIKKHVSKERQSVFLIKRLMLLITPFIRFTRTN